MKKIILMLTALLSIHATANAMSYEQARDQALFLTDKMAYELNLTEDQYEAAFEINLDYLMSVESVDDLYGTYWSRRNLDMSYILLDWQYRAYLDATYFYRPLYWDAGYWHFGIYARYPYRTYFYFGRPHFYMTYRGGHSWRMNGGRSWYYGRTFGSPHRNARDMHGFGMRNGFDRGDFRNHTGHFSRQQGGRALERSSRGAGNYGTPRSNGGMNRGGSMNRSGGNYGSPRSNGNMGDRQSSTRTTVGRPNNFNSNRTSGSTARPGINSGSSRGSASAPNRTFTPRSSAPSGSSSPATRSGSVSHGGSSVHSSSSVHGSSPSHSGVSSRGGSGSSHSSSGGSHFGGRR